MPEPQPPQFDQKTVRLETHQRELQSYGLRGLEDRMQRGLDPAGMLAVQETRKIAEDFIAKIGTTPEQVDELTKSLHVGAIWDNAEDLKKAEKPEIKAWMVLANACHEVNDTELSPDAYLADVDRIKGELQQAEMDPEAGVAKAVENIVNAAKEKFTYKDGVPFTEQDAFLHMAIAGEKYGVSKQGDLYFVGAKQLDYTMLDRLGLTTIQKEERGRTFTVYQRDGKDVAKQLYPGFALVFGDEALALKLAKTAETFN